MPTSPRAAPASEPVPAALLGDRGVFAWQKALHVAGTDLPEPVRYTLCVLALYMNPNGTQGRPGYERFALARGKSDRTIRTHLDKAAEAGWLRCTRRGGRNGDGTTRASVYMATIPAAVFARLAAVLEPAWGGDGQPQPETPELPVESPPHPEAQAFPVEEISTGSFDASTGNLGTSTGNAALPPTDHSHRPDTPISQVARVREAIRSLQTEYGLTDTEAATVWKAAEARSPDEVRHPVRYLDGMRRDPVTGAPKADLADIVEAVQLRSAQPLEAGQPDDPQDHPQPGAASNRTVAEAIAAANPDRQPTTNPAPLHSVDAPVCSHGEPNGATPNPATGLPACGPCRFHVIACKAGPDTCPGCRDLTAAGWVAPAPREEAHA